MLYRYRTVVIVFVFFLFFSETYLLQPDHVDCVDRDSHLWTLVHCNGFLTTLDHIPKTKICKVGPKPGKCNWDNLKVWAQLNTGTDFILSRQPAHFWVIGKRCVRVCVCVWTHSSFHEVSLTSQTPWCMALCSGWCPHTGSFHGRSHRSVSHYTYDHLSHTRLYLHRGKTVIRSERTGRDRRE